MGETEPANQNISLSSLTENPKRELAKGEIATLLHELEEYYEIPPSMLAELLFEFLTIEMDPDDPITSETAITWFAQLHRFRDSLQDKITAIEEVYAEAE